MALFGKKKKKLKDMDPAEAYEEAKVQEKNGEKKAMPYYLYAAENGHLEAQKRVARHYELGINDKKDMAKALYWNEKAAQQGDATAQWNCAKQYRKGAGCRKDLEKAFYWYSKGAAQGDEGCMSSLGSAYENGDGCEKDMEKALFWYERAAEAGSWFSAMRCGALYENGPAKDLHKSLHFYKLEREIYRKRIDNERRTSICHTMNYLLSDIERTHKDIDRIREMLGMGPEPRPELKPKELPEHSQTARLLLLDAQKCMETNPAAALKSYQIAAKYENDYLAQYECGIMYLDGKGCEEDKVKALYWFQKAAEQGDIDAQINCGIMYDRGEGCEEEYFKKEKALYWFEKAAEQGSVAEMVTCGIRYYTGEGCQKNEKLAFYWFEEAAMRGNEQAMQNLKVLTRQGVTGIYLP